MTPELRKRIEVAANYDNVDESTCDKFVHADGEDAWEIAFLEGAEAMYELMSERPEITDEIKATEVMIDFNSYKQAYDQLTQARELLEKVTKALESANKTLMYVQEEYASGHGVHLIYETVQTNKRSLTAYNEYKRSNEREEK